MPKTLKDFLEVYKPKSPDEQKFVDKHVVIKHKDRNGNGDDVFNGNTKTIKRKEERKGYDVGDDEKVYEALKGDQHKIDANKNGKVDAHDFHLLRKRKKVAEDVDLDEAVTVNKKNYSWGKMVTVHQGASTTYPLHPEHQEKIRKLSDGDKTTFKDETGATVHAHRSGDTVHLKKPGSSNRVTAVAHSHFTEEVDIDTVLDEALDLLMSIDEKTLTPAEMKKREEVVKAIKRENPKMDKSMAYAVATKTAKRVAEDTEDLEEVNIDKYADSLIKRDKQNLSKSHVVHAARVAGVDHKKLLTAVQMKVGRIKEETEELDESAKIAAHLIKRYGDNVRKSHVVSAANDFGVDASKLAKAVRTKLGKTSLAEEDDGWYTHSQMYGSKKSEKHPKGISAAEWKSGIRWHHGKNKRINIKEELEELDELSAKKLTDYTAKASDARGHRGMSAAKLDKRYGGVALAHEKIRARHAKVAAEGYIPPADEPTEANKKTAQKVRDMMAKEKKPVKEDTQIDELSKNAMLKYLSANKKSDAAAQEKGDYSKSDKRMRGTDVAVRKYTASPNSKYVRVPATEEVEIEEAYGMYKVEFPKQHAGKQLAAGSVHVKAQNTAHAHKVAAKRVGVDSAVFKSNVTKSSVLPEEVEAIDELSKKTLGSYIKKASGAEKPKNVMDPKNVPLTKIAAYQGDSETGHFGKRFNQATYDKAERLHKNRSQGITRATDKLTKEEVELVAEISKAMAGRYINKAKNSIDLTAWRQGYKEAGAGSPSKQMEKKLSKRHKGIETAVSKLTKEESEQIDEATYFVHTANNAHHVNKKIPTGKKDALGQALMTSKVVKSFPYGDSQSKQTSSDLHKAAYAYAKKLNAGMKNEEAEQIDELSKATMGRYINKAATKMGSQGVTAGLKIAADEKSSKNFKDMGKREKGIKLAVNKLTKEDAEQIDEISKKTLGRYVNKATDDIETSSFIAGKDSDSGVVNKNNVNRWIKQDKRKAGIATAVKKLTKEDIINRTIDKYVPEEAKYTPEERLLKRINGLSEAHVQTLLGLFEDLNKDNQNKMIETVETREGINQILNFVLENRGN